MTEFAKPVAYMSAKQEGADKLREHTDLLAREPYHLRRLLHHCHIWIVEGACVLKNQQLAQIYLKLLRYC
jgi:hypothetical protein